MKNWKEYLIDKKLKVKDAIKMLDKFQCIFVVNKNMELFGTVTDRDIRKALLNQINKDAPITEIMNKKPSVLREPLDYIKIRETLKDSYYEHYPIIDKNNKIVGAQNNHEIQNIRYVRAAPPIDRLVRVSTNCEITCFFFHSLMKMLQVDGLSLYGLP